MDRNKMLMVALTASSSGVAGTIFQWVLYAASKKREIQPALKHYHHFSTLVALFTVIHTKKKKWVHTVLPSTSV